MWRLAFAFLLLAAGAQARAQDVCPWLTQGTAAALMGGDVAASVHGTAGEGTCEFVRGTTAGSLRLRIAVGHLLPKECATGEHLSGIGQDAVFCRTDAGGEHRETIRGRVRTTYFLLTCSTREAGAGDATFSRSALEQAAEAVAGNLF